jgi:PAS domain S-box-containing protein
MDERTDGAGPESEVEPTAEVEADTGTAPGEDGQTGGKTTRRRRLEQYERIVETVDDGVYVLDEEFNIVRVNDAVSELTGYSRSELVGANAALLATEETIDQAAAVSEALRTGDGSAATITTTIQTADGKELPVETRFSVYEFSDGSYGQVGVVRDISDRLRYERTLTALHDSTRELLHAETPAEVCDLVTTTATEVIDLSAAAVYLLDAEATALRPEGAATDRPSSLPSLDPVSPGDGPVWETFVTGERRVDAAVPPAEAGDDDSPGGGVFIPLGDHGVFSVAVPDVDRVDPDTMELIDLVAASAEAALERVDRDARLRERDRELREQNEQLRRLEGINEVIRRIDRAVVGADSPDAVESAVCEELARSELFTFAWIGRVDGTAVEAGAWAGDGSQYLDAVDRSLAGEGGPPAVRTARTGEKTVVPSVVADLQAEPWRSEALSRRFQSAISVPLRRNEATVGVLTAFTSRQGDVTERMGEVFRDLGETVSDALRVAETKQWLSAESVVELDLAIRAPESPLTALATEAGADLVHDGTIATDDGASRTFLRVEGADFGAVRDAAREQAAVETVENRSADPEDPRVELHLSAPTIPERVTDQGSRIQSLTVGADETAMTVQVPLTATVRDLVERLDAAYESATLQARRDRTRPARTADGFRLAVREGLTDRQWRILRSAYLSGYFDWPRTTTGEEIADSFEVSQPTINRHLRVSERKLLALLFEDD